MIEILTANTPNGKKITIMCEEIGFEYKITKINIYKDEQFNLKFRVMSPFSKIPVIIDHDNNTSLFESGAILMYLGEKSGKFYPKDERHKINQWLMAQMGLVGPMIGQHHQFHYYNKGKSEFGEKRYFEITRRIYQDLDDRLRQSEYLAGENYTIADIATWPWIARHPRHDIGLVNYKHLSRWFTEIAKRPAVVRGYKFMDKNEEISLP